MTALDEARAALKVWEQFPDAVSITRPLRALIAWAEVEEEVRSVERLTAPPTVAQVDVATRTFWVEFGVVPGDVIDPEAYTAMRAALEAARTVV